MKDYKPLISQLRAESYSAKQAADAIEQLVYLHQLDISELVRLRRQIQLLKEEREA